MATKKNIKKKNLENLHLKERINYGYRKVIIMMLVSGLFSIVVIGMLFANMMHYIENVNAADQAVKICRINVNAAARNIREMALNNDASSYDNYEQTVERLLAEVNTELKNLKKSGVVPDADCEEYSSVLTDWGNIGYSIMKEIKSGDKDKAVDSILNDCTPALNEAVEIAIRLDEMTDELSSRSVRITVIFAVAGVACIIVCLVLAWKLTTKTGKKVLETILVPLREVEAVAQELTDGNLHSTLEYHSDDEIGRLAHSMRKSIRILGSYVDDIGRAMKMFAVVANQVNVLADQSAQAAKESATLIETSVKAVEKGMLIAGQTASQLQEVAENSQIITKEVTNIADTLETQATEIKQINDGIEQINDVVQTNSATSEECAASSQEMSSEAENLREMIQKFKIAEDKN